MGKDSTIGGIRINPSLSINGQDYVNTFSLLDENLTTGSEGRTGAITLKVKWYHTETPPKLNQKKVPSQVVFVAASAPDDVCESVGAPLVPNAFGDVLVMSMEENEVDSDIESESKTEDELAQELKLQHDTAEEKHKTKLAKIASLPIKSGDWQIQVHIIKVRDLAAKDDNGTSDPVVFVNCFDKKQNTRVKQKCTSAAFDEVFFFNAKDLDADEIRDSVVKIIIEDADVIGKNDEIGCYYFDVLDVYLSDKHEIYRTWCGK